MVICIIDTIKEMKMANLKKHIEKMSKSIDKKLGKGKGSEFLDKYKIVAGYETPKEVEKWVVSLSKHLEKNIDENKLIEIREDCACWKNSPVTKKVFFELRKTYTKDKEYLDAVSEFMTKKGRCGKKVEINKGEIISYFSDVPLNKHSCACGVLKDCDWKTPLSTTTWCRCCCGFIKNVYKNVFPEKICHVDIMETIVTGGNNCIFRTWFTDE